MDGPKELDLPPGWLERQFEHTRIWLEEEAKAYKRTVKRIAAYDKANPPTKPPTP